MSGVGEILGRSPSPPLLDHLCPSLLVETLLSMIVAHIVNREKLKVKSLEKKLKWQQMLLPKSPLDVGPSL